MALNCRTAKWHARTPHAGTLRRLRLLHGNSLRAMPWTSSRSTPPPIAASTKFANCAKRARYTPGPRPLQDLHSRRSPPDHGRRLQCAAENAGRTAGARHLHDGDHAAGRHSADHPLALPALQLSCRAISTTSWRSCTCIAEAEAVTAEEAALALLAEAGDGSMRDALSIMDQAIASRSAGQWRADAEAAQIRELMGSVPNAVFERLLEAVAAGQSAALMEQLNVLVNAGHSPSSLARQMVRYLRNTLMAKIGGEQTELLQISARRTRPRSTHGDAVHRRRDHTQPADHAAHLRRSELPTGAALPPGAGAAEADSCAATVADRRTAERRGERAGHAESALACACLASSPAAPPTRFCSVCALQPDRLGRFAVWRRRGGWNSTDPGPKQSAAARRIAEMERTAASIASKPSRPAHLLSPAFPGCFCFRADSQSHAPTKERWRCSGSRVRPRP